MIDDLIIILLQDYEHYTDNNGQMSFDGFIKIYFPRSYKYIQDDLKYWKEKHKEYEVVKNETTKSYMEK